MKLLKTATLASLSLTLAVQARVAAADPAPILLSGKAVAWGAPPPVFPRGARFAVLHGDPSKAGDVTVRLDMPAGYVIPPHFHPTDEHVTVLRGDFSIGMGDAVDRAHAAHLAAGGYGVAMADMHHYAYTDHGATVQVHLRGPFALTYVNPADDPSRVAAPAVH